MDNYSIKMVLDKPGASYDPGETVSGHLLVTAPDNCLVTKLYLGLGAKAYARGDIAGLVNPRQGLLTGENLFQGSLQSGETRKFSFSLNPAPVSTFAGKFMAIDYFIQVALHVSGTQQVKNYPVAFTQPEQKVHCLWDEKDLKSNAGFNLAVAAVFLSLVPVLAVLAFVMFKTWLLGIALVPAFLGITLVVLNWKLWLAERKIGPVTMVVNLDKGLQADGSARQPELKIRIISKPVDEAGPAWASLTVRERVTKKGDGRQIWTNEIYQDVIELKQRPESKEFIGNLVLPETGVPYNFQLGEKSGGSAGSSSYEIQWELKGHVDVKKWPDWEKSTLLRVRPLAVPFD